MSAITAWTKNRGCWNRAWWSPSNRASTSPPTTARCLRAGGGSASGSRTTSRSARTGAKCSPPPCRRTPRRCKRSVTPDGAVAAAGGRKLVYGSAPRPALVRYRRAAHHRPRENRHGAQQLLDQRIPVFVERAAHHRGIPVHAARRGKTVRLSRRIVRADLVRQAVHAGAGARGHHRIRRRFPAPDRIVLAAGRAHHVRRNGVRLFHGPLPAQPYFPHPQWWRSGGAVLLHVPVPVGRRSGTVQPGSCTSARVTRTRGAEENGRFRQGGHAMHKSRLSSIVIDCKTDDLESATRF